MARFNEEERKYIKKLFDAFDTDKSGQIDFGEFKILARKLGVEMGDDDLKASISRIDPSPEPELDFEQFLSWMEGAEGGSDAVLKAKIRAQGLKPLNSNQIQGLKECFDHFDTDGSGSIDSSELGEVFKAFGQEVSEEEIQRMLAEVDEDGSGEIEFDEFLMLMIHNFGGEESGEQEIQDLLKKHAAGDGLISKTELGNVIRELCGTNEGKDFISEAEIREVLDCAEQDSRAALGHRKVPIGMIEYMKWDCLWKALAEN
eukprot:Hpha_TRINITY_DN23305_c0_g1::TRINITY_DN23305_c0_g1_i1::g.96854::m.96854/K16465/CETN1; centrin-1